MCVNIVVNDVINFLKEGELLKPVNDVERSSLLLSPVNLGHFVLMNASMVSNKSPKYVLFVERVLRFLNPLPIVILFVVWIVELLIPNILNVKGVGNYTGVSNTQFPALIVISNTQNRKVSPQHP